MAYNKIPLALAYDDNTGNASGLVEFTLGLSDAGDVCDTAPEQGQALVFSGTEWCPSTLPAPGEFTGNLSDVGQVCSAAPTNGQVLTWSGAAGEWCPSTVATGGGGVTSVNGSAGVVVLTTANINEVTNLYYTEARVTANGSVADNTAKLTANATNVTNAGALMVAGGTITGNLAIEGTLKSTSVYENSLVITTGASAVSSLSGASGTIPYFEGATPAPGLKTFAQILTNENYNISPGATYQPLDSDLTSIAGLSVAAGSIIYATAANTYAVLAPGSSGQVLSMNGATALRWITLPEQPNLKAYHHV